MVKEFELYLGDSRGGLPKNVWRPVGFVNLIPESEKNVKGIKKYLRDKNMLTQETWTLGMAEVYLFMFVFARNLKYKSKESQASQRKRGTKAYGF